MSCCFEKPPGGVGEESVDRLGGAPPDERNTNRLARSLLQNCLGTHIPGGLEGSGGGSFFSSLFWLMLKSRPCDF